MYCHLALAHASKIWELEYGAAAYEMTGSDMTILSNRINYVFNLKGPSMTVDTACSSSLYALHLACQSLMSGDSEAAIVGGTNVILDIEQHIASVRLGVMSSTSTCHTFDECADGFGRGEGICAVYLKKLSTAVANGDPIRGVIRATAINANGRSQGINHPEASGQEAVIRAAYAKANLNFDDTAYFECHGTGTPFGDPIEVAAVASVFASGRTPQNPLLLGSIKTNIGHTEGASGLASVIKAVLSIENGLVAATVGIERLNPAIDLKEGRLHIVQATTPWPKGTLKRASINSFGYGGANAHCIIESPEVLLESVRQDDRNGTLNGFADHPDGVVNATKIMNGEFGADHSLKRYMLVFSAHDQLTLQKNIAALANVAHKHRLTDIAHTLAYKRTRHRVAAFGTVTSTDVECLSVSEKIRYASQMTCEKPVVAFVFTGQGAQWPAMGSTLIHQYPIVRKTMENLQSALDSLPIPPSWRLVEELSKPAGESRMHDTALSQPLCTALQIALTVLLQSWGLQTQAVVGHSSGEVAAAFAAGLLTSSEAIAIAYFRGIAVSKHGKPGSMMAVGLGAEGIIPYITHHPDIVVACQNSPQSVTLSGDTAAITEIHDVLVRKGIFARKVNSSNNAYHSHLVKEAGQYYEDSFKSSLPDIEPTLGRSNVPMHSCITGEVLISPSDVRIGYWRKNLESFVNFTQALSSLIAAQPAVNCLVEIGPHSSLAGPIKQIRSLLELDSEQLCYFPSIVRGEDNVENILKLAGTLFTAGYPIDMSAVNADGGPEPKFLPDLPTYQWHYEGPVLSTDNRLSCELRYRRHPRHDLLGSRLLGNSDFNPEWRNKLKLKHVPWITDHQIGDEVIFPAAGYLAMAIEAVTQFAEIWKIVIKGYTFRRMLIQAPLNITPEGDVETLFGLRTLQHSSLKTDRRIFDFSVSSVNIEGKWTEHAVGVIALDDLHSILLPDSMNIEPRAARNQQSNDSKWYTALANIGLHYGPAFRLLSNIRATSERHNAVSHINLESTKGTMVQESRYMIHPTVLDGCIQLTVIAACDGDVKGMSKPYLPTIIENLTIWQVPDSPALSDEGIIQSHGIIRGMRSVHGSSKLYSSDGHQLAQMTVSLLSLEGNFANQKAVEVREPYARLVWQPDVDRLDEGGVQRLFLSDANNQSVSNWQLRKIVKLIAHKDPNLSVLYIEMCLGDMAERILEALQGNSSRPLYKQFTLSHTSEDSSSDTKDRFRDFHDVECRTLNIEQDPLSQGFEADTFDLVFVASITEASRTATRILENCRKLLKHHGRVTIIDSSLPKQIWKEQLESAGLSNPLFLPNGSTKESPCNLMLSTVAHQPQIATSKSARLWLVYRKCLCSIAREIETQASGQGLDLQSIPLLDVDATILRGHRVLVLAEFEGAMLVDMTKQEMNTVKHMFRLASSVVWVTRGGLLKGKQPEHSIISGMAKSIMAAQPSLRLSCVDIDPDEGNEARSAAFILQYERDLREDADHALDDQLVVHEGIAYISRYVPDQGLNEEFTRQLTPFLEPRPMLENLELTFQRAGQVDSFYFKKKACILAYLEAGQIELTPILYNLGVAEAAILKGVQVAEYFSNICVATVSKAAPDALKFKVGDQVLCVSAGRFDSSFITNEGACELLLPNENAGGVASSLLPYCTALYALERLGSAEQGQTILLHEMSGSMLVAATHLCVVKGCKPILTFNSEENKELFLENHPDIDIHKSLISGPGFAAKLNALTQGNGIHIALTLSKSSDTSEVWRSLARNGRLIYVLTNSELPNLGLLDPSVFSRGASFASFSMADMIETQAEEVATLARKVLSLLRSETVPMITPQATYEVSKLPEAVSALTEKEPISGIAITYGPHNVVPTHLDHEQLEFSPEASYLLVGCLGGLGRSFAGWMLSRGARNLVFLSRSGIDKPEAVKFIHELENIGRKDAEKITVVVIRGDVSDRADVYRAISMAPTPIRGVMQQAMVLAVN